MLFFFVWDKKYQTPIPGIITFIKLLRKTNKNTQKYFYLVITRKDLIIKRFYFIASQFETITTIFFIIGN